MAFDRFSTYITWGGFLGQGTAEIWQTGLHLADKGGAAVPGMPTTAELQNLLDTVLTTAHQSTSLKTGPGASLVWAKAAALNLEGEYTGAPVFVERAAVNGGASATQSASVQDALVLTLWSGSTFGRANYGRLYLPWNCLNVQNTDGKISSADRASALVAAQNLINGIHTAAEGWASTTDDISPMIMSSVGSGQSKQALFIRIGDVKDTQRRRRNRFDEVYSQGTLNA